MRIAKGIYPEEKNVTKWLDFDSATEAKISLVLAWRLAALARDNGTILSPSEGFRTYERQLAFYNAYIAGNGKYAAKPGNSWHEFSVAVDLGDNAGFWKRKSISEWMPYSKFKQQSLNKYGLCIPLNHIDMPNESKQEHWHCTAIEVYNSGFSGVKAKFLQSDDAILDWESEKKKAVEINEIVDKLADSKMISSEQYWSDVLFGNKQVDPAYLLVLLERIAGIKREEIVANKLIENNKITNAEYWKKAMTTTGQCNPEYLKILLSRLV